MSDPSHSNWFYWTAQKAVQGWLRLWLRFKIHGAENVPARGGCILASNHASFLDPPMVACGIDHRIVQFMTRDTLYSSWIRRWFMNRIECIPIDRTKGDVAALRKGIRTLKEGHVVVLFPEGTRSLTGELQPAKGGIAFLVAKAGVPVVPVYVEGSHRALPKGGKWIKPVRTAVYFGRPIPPEEIKAVGDDREAYEKIGQLIMSHIAALNPSLHPKRGQD